MPSASQIRALAALARCLSRPACGRPLEPQPEPFAEPLAAALPDDLVRRHFLAPLAYRAGVGRFRRDFIASSLMAELRERTLHQAVQALADRGIPVILLKGISYARQLYVDPAERPMSDLDLLVPPAAHAAAAAALARLGYWQAGSHRQRSRFHHAVAFKRRGAAIDLHRSMIQPLRSRIDVHALWRRAVDASEHGPGVRRLAPVDEAVIHLSHVARHELMVPLINYVDAARLLHRLSGDRGAVLARARQFRLERAARTAMAMTDAIMSNAAGPRSPMPPVREVLAYGPVWRPLQCLRKALLVDGPVELAGLAVIGAYGQLAHRLRP